MANEMIERVARAMWARNLERGAGEYCAPWDDETEVLREDWRSFARAAIEEMRDPSDAMRDAGNDTCESGRGDDNPIAVWRVMIDAALSTPSPVD